MKRFLSTAMILGILSPFGLVGCAEKSKVEESQTVSTPGGSETTTTTTEVKKTGDEKTGETGAAAPVGGTTEAPK